MKSAFSFLLLTAAFLPSCQQTAEKQAQAQVASDIRAHFSRPGDYHPGSFRSRPYTRYDSLVYLARTAVLNAAVQSAATSSRPTLALPPRRPADTVRIGTLISHTYQAPIEGGAMRTDSVEYVVYNDGRRNEVIPTYALQARLQQLAQ